MVRIDPTQDSSEDKKDCTSKKRALERKKGGTVGIWPCEINGCNKQFAREADLRRHQRTTKLHSMPSFSCPQCDATFTRTDAQRRHQKSRHNGVIIESSDGDEGSQRSSTGSRSSSDPPPRKEKERKPIPSQIQQAPRPVTTGSNNYYRQYTATPSPHSPLDSISEYHQINHPTSSARTTTAHWQYQWPSTPTNPHYTPSPHYRPSAMGHASYHPPQTQPPPSLPALSNSSTTGSSRSSGSPRNTPISAPPSHHAQSAPLIATADQHPQIPIDPALTASDNGDDSELTQAEVEAAMQAVMKYAEVDSASKRALEVAHAQALGMNNIIVDLDSLNGSASASSANRLQPFSSSASSIGDFEGERERCFPLHRILHDYGPTLGRPEPMEHLLTEDGEPMLNPAELLTQESLASPPPSHEMDDDDT